MTKKIPINFHNPGLESRASRILDALDATIVVLDDHGNIIASNESWQVFADQNRMIDGSLADNTTPGSNYLEICRNAVGPSSEGALLVYEGIRAVLDGKLKTFSHEYPCHSPDKQRWFCLKAKPLPNSKPREIIIVHEDITARTLAEIESQSRQRQLANALSQLQTLASDIKNYMQVPQASLPTWDIQDSAQIASQVELLRTLSERELEVLKGLTRGERNASIAQRLGLSVKSVSTYRSRILKKLKLESNADLVTFSSQAGFL